MPASFLNEEAAITWVVFEGYVGGRVAERG